MSLNADIGLDNYEGPDNYKADSISLYVDNGADAEIQ
jgi:hypothetical protein